MALGVQYEFPIGAARSLRPRLDWKHQSKIYFNNSGIEQDAYGLLSARITWESADATWSAALFGTNLTDEEYFDGKLALQAALGSEQGNIAAPRQWGLSFRRSF